MENQEPKIAEAKEWLKQNARTPWAMMRLELMEEYNPVQLMALARSGALLQKVKQDEQELTERHMDLMRSGEYNGPSEIGDVMRAQLIEEATGPTWSVEELLDQALTQGKSLTPEQKEFLRENLPPRLAREVDLLP